MPESLTDFVSRRRSDWARLEVLLERIHAHQLRLDELAEVESLYRHATADLALAQAAFSSTDVSRFLNQLCGRAYRIIYRDQKANVERFRTFYTSDFPAAVQASLRYILMAAAFMSFGLVLGGATIAVHPSMAPQLLPGELMDFIQDSQLWTDVAATTHAPSELAVAIFLNNLRVIAAAFAAGITCGIGTALLLIYNGFFLGGVIVACLQHQLGAGIFNFITAHGPVELSIMCITGGAGLIIGHALIEPGERRRGDHLRERARLAVQLVLGCAPFIVAIGIVEGFVSPGTFFAWPLKGLIGCVSFLGFWRYLLFSRHPAH